MRNIWYINKVNKKVKKESNEALDNAVDIIVRDAKRMAPVKSGKLKSSIKKEKVSEEIINVRADVKYALFVELGTFKRGAQPFIRPAVAKNKANILRKFKDIL